MSRHSFPFITRAGNPQWMEPDGDRWLRSLPLRLLPVLLEQIAEGLFNYIIEPSAFPNDTGGSFMSYLIPPGEIERGYDHDEKEPVTNNANNKAWPPFTHSSSSRPHIRTAHIGYFPFGRRPFRVTVIMPAAPSARP